ncbi:SUKH-3 domain-containing protein [Streptomyces sp. NPDC086787]|uniref:SUKH-3 domain-containing protein n=1 Tax=Streptomyces sp. NPDC086787 TaxID=3365759 RepID=UPI0038023E65
MIGEEDRFADWSHTIGRAIFPLGELDEGRFFLGIDENSAIYLVETWLATFGSAQDALEKLILGIAPERIETADWTAPAGPGSSPTMLPAGHAIPKDQPIGALLRRRGIRSLGRTSCQRSGRTCISRGGRCSRPGGPSGPGSRRR